jgi:hypothetical protein
VDGTADEDIFDYAVLTPKLPGGGTRILAVAVGRAMLLSYRNALLGAGWNLKVIGIGMGAEIRLAGILPQLSSGSSILSEIDGRNLTLTLFENGNFLINNKHRLLNAEDTPEWTAEIGNHISSMIQFHKSQRSDFEITNAYFTGVTPVQTAQLATALSYLGIHIGDLDLSDKIKIANRSAAASKQAEFAAGKYLLNLGNLLPQKKEINLLLAMDRQKVSSRKNKGVSIVVPIVVVVLVAVAMGAGYSYFYNNTSGIKAQKEAIELYLSDPATTAAYNESLTAQSEAARMTAEMSALRDVILNITSYPNLMGGDLDQVREIAGSRIKLSVMTYDKTSGVLSFNATSDTVTGVPLFIAQMRISGIFSDVQYQGYSESTRTEPGKPKIEYDETGAPYEVPTTLEFKEYNFAVTALVNAPTPYIPPQISGPVYSAAETEEGGEN